MDLGSTFVGWCPYRGWVVGEVVWTGSQSINPPSDVSMASSLLNAGPGMGPAKAIGPGGSRATRGTGIVSQTAMRA